MLLAIETSCDETAVCLFKLEKNDEPVQNVVHEIISSQASLHGKYGGVVPELAAREHIKNLPLLVSNACADAGINLSELTAIAVTQGPGLKGCLLVGVSFAKALSHSLEIPLIPIHHLEAHIFSGFLLKKEDQPQYPFLTLLVSGGHSALIYVESFRNYKIVASTQDDAAGEAFDKGAVLLGLSYPGGPEISRWAEKGDSKKYDLPVGMPRDMEKFSFSGLKTALARKKNDLEKEFLDQVLSDLCLSDLCASYQQTIIDSLMIKSLAAVEKLCPQSFLLTGGVAANKSLREQFAKMLKTKNVHFSAVPHKWCTDNAVMVAALAAQIYHNESEEFLNWKYQSSNNKLGPNVSFDIGAMPRWSIEGS